MLFADPLPFTDDHFATLDLEEHRFDRLQRPFLRLSLFLVERQVRLQQLPGDVDDDRLQLKGIGEFAANTVAVKAAAASPISKTMLVSGMTSSCSVRTSRNTIPRSPMSHEEIVIADDAPLHHRGQGLANALAQSRRILQLTERRERFRAQLNTENPAELLLALSEEGTRGDQLPTHRRLDARQALDACRLFRVRGTERASWRVPASSGGEPDAAASMVCIAHFKRWSMASMACWSKS